MTRRTLASVVVGVLLAALVVAAAFLPVPYVTMSPGPTVDVYAAGDDGTVVSVVGARTYPTKGELRVTTVSVTSPGQDLALVDALAAGFDRTVQSGQVGRDRLAQRGDAEVVRIEGVAVVERLLGGITDEVRRLLIRLAEPERQHVLQADTCVGDFTDA